METQTTQDERPTAGERDDVHGFMPALFAAALGIGIGLAFGIGFVEDGPSLADVAGYK